MKQVYKDINKIIIDMGLEAPVKGELWESACHKILSALILNQKKLSKAIEQRDNEIRLKVMSTNILSEYGPTDNELIQNELERLNYELEEIK